jgi:hypothetical protein
MADPSETTHASGRLGAAHDEDLVDAVRSLSTQVAGLQHEVQSLRSEARGLPGHDERPGWDDGAPIPRDGSAWVRTLDTPSARRLRIPWLAVEIAFLVAVAALAVAADLEGPLIAGLMIVAWALVAVAEWLLARAARAEHAVIYGPGPVVTRLPDDRSWFGPTVDDTVLGSVEPGEQTAARLPPPEPD